MPTTAKNHFDDDIARSLNLHAKAKDLEDAGDTTRLPKDIRGAALALAVGAMDAYFCDKYIDCLSRALNAYSQNLWPGTFPSAYSRQLLPAGEVLDASRSRRPRWGIRMAAREAMRKDNMYSLSRIDEAFNGILPAGQKLWLAVVPNLAALNRVRLTRHVTADLAVLTGDNLVKAQKEVVAAVKKRIGITVQFRHDWIHNCSRPRDAIKDWSHGETSVGIREIKDLVGILDAHIQAHRLA